MPIQRPLNKKRNPNLKKPREIATTTLKGVDRAHVLEYIASHPEPATEISEVMELPWATLFRTFAPNCDEPWLLSARSPRRAVVVVQLPKTRVSHVGAPCL